MWTWFSGPFGSDAPNANPQGAGDSIYDLRFPGQIAGAWGGTYQNYFRDYDPAVGRYLESGPIGFAGGSFSTYNYAEGMSTILVDPLGLRPLTESEKCQLATYIPQIDLDNADLHNGQVPWYLLRAYTGITRGNDIYFRPGVYEPERSRGSQYWATTCARRTVPERDDMAELSLVNSARVYEELL